MKIPETAKLVHKGIVFDVYQWEQELFDGTKTTFEGLKRPNTVQVIPLLGDKIVLAKEQQPLTRERYTFLGGRQEPGEEPLETAKRELLEEAGLSSDNWEMISAYEPSGKIEWTVCIYAARDCQKISEQKLDAGEKIELEEVTWDDFVDKVSSRNFWEKMCSNDVFRMKYEGGLEEYKQKIYGK
ncbi:MAG TPA: NUDIX hydrolase [bacterium]|nr:MAG: ADP-ribose pyrophosphatase [Parcubacteria group bacterium ADurb.Bin192]HPN14961.1 NUDIX hydrolase [bacterium]